MLFLLILLISTSVLNVNSSLAHKCTAVYPTKDGRGRETYYYEERGKSILSSDKLSLEKKISLNPDEVHLPVMVVGQLISSNLFIDWLYPSTEIVNLIIIVGMGNFINGEKVLSGYKATKHVASEIGYVSVNLADVCDYDYVSFQICKETIGKISMLSYQELLNKCNPSQIVLADRENKIEFKILNTRTFEDKVEFEFNSEISIEGDKSTNLECIATDLNNQKDKWKHFSIQYLKTYVGRTDSNLMATKALSKNSTYKCLLLVNSPNYYQLYSSEMISFSVTRKKGKNKITNSEQVEQESKKRVTRTATTKLDAAVIKQIEAYKAGGKNYDKHQSGNFNPRMYNVRTVEEISQEIKNKVKDRIEEYNRKKQTEVGQIQEKISINKERNCRIKAVPKNK